MKPQYIQINEYGDKFYFSDKELKILHREDGPAIEGARGDKSWWINGHSITEDEFNARKSPCVGKAAMAFRNAAFVYLNACDNGGVCSDRTCLRCRIADAAFEVEQKHGILPMPSNAAGQTPAARTGDGDGTL